MTPKHIVLSFLVILAFSNWSLQAQCFKSVEYRVIASQLAIEIVFDADYDQVTVNLENARMADNKVFENSINLGNVTRGRKYIVFEDLIPSKYLIQLVTEDCKWVIGGIEGIIIKDEDEK